jgi:hypothetical protein
VLHCDKASWFRHIEASPLRFGGLGLIVSSDNGLRRILEFEERGVLKNLMFEVQGSYQ